MFELVMVFFIGGLIGAIVTYFIARNNQKHLEKAFNVDDTIRAEFEELKAKARARAYALKKATRGV